MNVNCSVITNPIKILANKLDKTPGFVNNLVSVWQTKTGKVTSYPTLEELKEFKKSLSDEDIELAIPEYSVEEYTPGSVPIHRDANNKIVLTKLPKERPLDYFFLKFGNVKNPDRLKAAIRSGKEAYNYILWREMGFIERGSKTTDDKDIVEEEALLKAEKYAK